MKQIRQSVFETNSSSTHSISVSYNTKGIQQTLDVDNLGVVTLDGGEFGWQEEEFYSAQIKANYCAVFFMQPLASLKEYDKDNSKDILQLNSMKNMFEKVIKEHTGCKEIVYDFQFGECMKNNWSYIDHASGYFEGGDCLYAFKSEENLKAFLFNPDSYVKTDNDNH